MIAFKHREPEGKVLWQRLLFVAKVHGSLPRFGKAVTEKRCVQARRGRITGDGICGKSTKAIDDCRDCGLPTGRILSIKPAVHYFSKLDLSLLRDLQEGVADHALRCVNRPARKAR